MGEVMQENDKTIFSYLDPKENEYLGMMNVFDCRYLLKILNRYYLEYRDSLGIDRSNTFGIEIEFGHVTNWLDAKWEMQKEIEGILNNSKWFVKYDCTLYDVQGLEINSDILRDNKKCWDDIKTICSYCSSFGRMDSDCASHIHVGAQVLGDEPLYWKNLFKLWSVYENVIYRFFYGEYLNYRSNILQYAKVSSRFYEERLSLIPDNFDGSLLDMLKIIEGKRDLCDRYTKKYGLSYWRILADDNYCYYEDFNKCHNGCTIECRVPNGTLNEIIWQNNINFFIKLMLFCKSDKFNLDVLMERRLKLDNVLSHLDTYSDIYLEQAIELCDMIFDNNLDKIYFLRQYLKSFEVRKGYTLARKFTWQ